MSSRSYWSKVSSDNSLMGECEKEQVERKEPENVLSLPEIQVVGENYSDFVKL